MCNNGRAECSSSSDELTVYILSVSGVLRDSGILHNWIDSAHWNRHKLSSLSGAWCCLQKTLQHLELQPSSLILKKCSVEPVLNPIQTSSTCYTGKRPGDKESTSLNKTCTSGTWCFHMILVLCSPGFISCEKVKRKISKSPLFSVYECVRDIAGIYGVNCAAQSSASWCHEHITGQPCCSCAQHSGR